MHKKGTGQKIEKVESRGGGRGKAEMPSHIFACYKCDNTRKYSHTERQADRHAHTHAYILRKFHAQFQI